MSVVTQFFKKVFLPENQQSLNIVDRDGNSYATTAHYVVDFIGQIKNFETLNEILIIDMGYENKVVELGVDEFKTLLSQLKNIIENNWVTADEREKANQFFQWANEHIKKDEPFYGNIGFLYCLEIN
jgi:hypothetical protein